MVVDNKLLYANDTKIYSRDLSTGKEEVILDVATTEHTEPTVTTYYGIDNMLIDSENNVYIERRVRDSSKYSYIVYKINPKQPGVILTLIIKSIKCITISIIMALCILEHIGTVILFILFMILMAICYVKKLKI